MLKMYDEIAGWWHLLSSPEEYRDEAEFFINALVDAGVPEAPSVLELGSGGGNNALYLKAWAGSMVLTDLSPAMLALSRTINPECEHLVGDMRTLRLGRDFDVVFIHDAIEYMNSHDELRQALQTAYVHCRPGGTALVVPDQVRESWAPDTDHGGHDGETRGLRYLEWTYDPDPADTTYITEYAFLLREQGHPTRMIHEQHVHGLFARADWLALFREVGFKPTILSDSYDRDVFVARRTRQP